MGVHGLPAQVSSFVRSSLPENNRPWLLFCESEKVIMADDKRTSTAWCKPCKKATKYILIGTGPCMYIACEECGSIYYPVNGDQLGVLDELKVLYQLRTS